MKFSLRIFVSLAFFAMVSPTVPVLAQDSFDNLDHLPITTTLDQASGWAWLRVNGRPMRHRYKIIPTAGKYCEFSVGFVKYENTQRHLQLHLTYFDPQMVENKGEKEIYEVLNWTPTEAQPTPFYPSKSWSSIVDEKYRAKVSYNKKNHQTIITSIHDSMFVSYHWTTVTTTPDYKTVTGVSMSWANDKNAVEDDRMVVLNCTNSDQQ